MMPSMSGHGRAYDDRAALWLARGNPKRVGGVLRPRQPIGRDAKDYKEFYCCSQNTLDTKNLELCGMKVSACLPPTHQAESQADLAKAQAVFEGASLKASEFPSDLARE